MVGFADSVLLARHLASRREIESQREAGESSVKVYILGVRSSYVHNVFLQWRYPLLIGTSVGVLACT